VGSTVWIERHFPKTKLMISNKIDSRHLRVAEKIYVPDIFDFPLIMYSKIFSHELPIKAGHVTLL